MLVDSVGIKLSDRETPDILDVFNTHPEDVRRRTWHDEAHAPDFNAMSDEALMNPCTGTGSRCRGMPGIRICTTLGWRIGCHVSACRRR